MKKISIVPEIINSEGIIILDENRIPVNICKKSKFLFTDKFVWPTIIIDNFERGKYKDIEIRNIELHQLLKYGYRLVAFKASAHTRNRPRQSKCYTLEHKNNPIPNSEILYRIPKEHFLEMDTVNNRVRIRGKNAYPYHRSQDASPWVSVVPK